MADCTWSFALREGGNCGDVDSDSSDEEPYSSQTRVSLASQSEEGQVKYKPNPWSIAKINAATRSHAAISYTKAPDRSTVNPPPSQQSNVGSGLASLQPPRTKKNVSIQAASVNQKQQPVYFSSGESHGPPSKTHGHRATEISTVSQPPVPNSLPLKRNAISNHPKVGVKDPARSKYLSFQSREDLVPHVHSSSTTRLGTAHDHNSSGALEASPGLSQSRAHRPSSPNTVNTSPVNIPWTPQSPARYPRARPEDFESYSFATSSNSSHVGLDSSNGSSLEPRSSSILDSSPVTCWNISASSLLRPTSTTFHNARIPGSKRSKTSSGRTRDIVSLVEAKRISIKPPSDDPRNFQTTMQPLRSQATEKTHLPSPRMTSPLPPENTSSNDLLLNSFSLSPTRPLALLSYDPSTLQASAKKRPRSASSTPPSSPTPQPSSFRPPYFSHSKSVSRPQLPPIQRANLEAADEVAWSTLPARKIPKTKKAGRSGIITTARFSLPLAAFSDTRGGTVQGTAKTAYRPPPKRTPGPSEAADYEPLIDIGGWRLTTVGPNISTSCAPSTRTNVEMDEVLKLQNDAQRMVRPSDNGSPPQTTTISLSRLAQTYPETREKIREVSRSTWFAEINS